MWSLMIFEDCMSFCGQTLNCNWPLLLPSSTLSHSGMHHYRNHFMLQWYLLSHRAKNKQGDCYVEWSHEYMRMLLHTQRSESFLVVVNKRSASYSLNFAVNHRSRQCEDRENAALLDDGLSWFILQVFVPWWKVGSMFQKFLLCLVGLNLTTGWLFVQPVLFCFHLKQLMYH